MLEAFLLPLAVGVSSLTVVTGTPDALCPTLEQARAAVAARVGEVQGGPFVANYDVVRDPERGTKAIRLTLLGPEQETLLERHLDLSAGDCAITAQALALILEAYFDSAGAGAGSAGAAETRPEGEAPAPIEDGEEGTLPAPPAEAPPSERSPEANADPEAPSALSQAPQPNFEPLRFYARLGAGVDHLGGWAATIGAGGWLNSQWRLGIELVVPVQGSPRQESEFDLKLYTGSAYLGLAYSMPICGRTPGSRSRCRLDVGPVFGSHLQRLSLDHESLAPESGGTRWAASAGGGTRFSFDFTPRMGIDLGVRAGVLFGGRRFVVAEVQGRPSELVALPQFLGDANLAWRVTF